MPLTPVFDPTTGASGGAVAGGGSTTPVWLTAATTQAYLPQTGSSFTTLTWGQPTNGVAPFTYTAVDLVDASQGSPYWEYDLATRTISVAPTASGFGGANDRPFIWRIEVTDSVGNFGRIWVIGWYSGSASQYTYFLDPIVVGPTDAFGPYTFPSASGTSVGVNLQTSWRSTGGGNGWVSPTPELMTSATPNRRYQGPFTVDVPAGEVFCLCTTQQEGTSTAYYIRVCQPFIRTHDASKTYWEARTISDIDYRAIGTVAPVTIAGPYVTTLSTTSTTWNPTVGTTDLLSIQYNASPAGTGSTNTTELMALNSSGLVASITNNVATSNARALQPRVIHSLRFSDGLASSFTQNPTRFTVGCGTSELIYRMRCRFDLTGTTGPNIIFSVSPDGTYNGGGGMGVYFDRQSSAIAPWAANQGGRMRLHSGSNYIVLSTFEYAAWGGQEIGIDFYVTTESVCAVVYRWADAGSAYPDLNLPDPYAGFDTMIGRMNGPVGSTNSSPGTSIVNGVWGIFGTVPTTADACAMYAYLGSGNAVSSAIGNIYALKTMMRSRRIVPA